jgi:hypothetical protein
MGKPLSKVFSEFVWFEVALFLVASLVSAAFFWHQAHPKAEGVLTGKPLRYQLASGPVGKSSGGEVCLGAGVPKACSGPGLRQGHEVDRQAGMGAQESAKVDSVDREKLECLRGWPIGKQVGGCASPREVASSTRITAGSYATTASSTVAALLVLFVQHLLLSSLVLLMPLVPLLLLALLLQLLVCHYEY